MLHATSLVAYYAGLAFLAQLVAKLIFDTLNGLRIHLGDKFFPINLVSKYGNWAVVTGCTDGIGCSYVIELARRGLNVALISRNEAKLRAVAQKIETVHRVHTKIIVADFASSNPVLYENIVGQLQDIEVGILGVISPHPMRVDELTSQQVWEHITVNVAAATQLSRLLLPGMRERGKGAIVNICSLMSRQLSPFMAVYGATKAYQESFSQSLQIECRGTGVTVQTLIPSFINTKMVAYSSYLSSGGLLVPTSDIYAKHAINTLGRTSYTTGYLPHGFQAWISDLLPRRIRSEIFYFLLQYFRQQYDNMNKQTS